jgi:hopanoid biosynthesis associated radical SAM protein HpnJ
MRTLFLHPPSYEGFDGGAGSRYQARREIRSFWYPTWLAQAAALVPGSKLVDAPPDGLTIDEVAPLGRQYDLVVIHTSTPSFASDARAAARLKAENPRIVIGMVGAHVAVLPRPTLQAAPAVDWVAVGEFDHACAEVASGRALCDIGGLAFRAGDQIRFTRPRPPIEDMDALPSVIDVYRRDLTIANYVIGYLRHPFVSLYTGRGCRSKCTFCLWPQTVGGHRYRVRSAANVEAEMVRAKVYFPHVKEFFFDDDTFTDDLPRAEDIAHRLGRLGLTWSCNAKANVPRRTLEVLRANGLRLLLVGYESGSQQILNNIRKGVRLDVAREFTRHAKALGITIHGTFILGLPGETAETIRETVRFACDIEPDTIQVSLAAPYPGTELYRQARHQGWLREAPPAFTDGPDGESGAALSDGLVDPRGVQVAALEYLHLSRTEIYQSLETFYRRFYFRPRKLVSMVGSMLTDPALARRRLREGAEFFRFLRRRRGAGVPSVTAAPGA